MRNHVDPEAAAKLVKELRAWHAAGGNLYHLADASKVARTTIAGWIARGAPKGAVDYEKVMAVLRASRPRK
jgi:hypothetical protein